LQKLRVLVSLITEDNDYQRQQAAVAQATAQKLEIDTDVLYANNDAVTQSVQIVRAIQLPPGQRPQAIIVEPVGTPMPQVAHAAAAANIGWVMLNRSADYLAAMRTITAAPIFCLSSDNEEVGHLQGRNRDQHPAPAEELWVSAATSTPIQVIVGSLDTESRPIAPGQVGASRLERAQAWVAGMHALAARNGKASRVTFIEVPDTAHDERKMAVAAKQMRSVSIAAPPCDIRAGVALIA